jgi:hypothetical protein
MLEVVVEVLIQVELVVLVEMVEEELGVVVIQVQE